MATGTKYKRDPDVSWRAIEGQAVLVHNKKGEIQVLNNVGTFIWERLDKNTDEILDEICREYDTDKAQAQRDMQNFLKELLENEAISPAENN
jgi:hypothetical protein